MYNSVIVFIFLLVYFPHIYSQTSFHPDSPKILMLIIFYYQLFGICITIKKPNFLLFCLLSGVLDKFHFQKFKFHIYLYM